jgi:hypothetical protein
VKENALLLPFRRSRLQRTRLVVERLEDRLTPATTWNVPWPDPGHLTLSFAPDGTDVGGTPNALFQTLDAVAATATWQKEILRAVRTWAVHGNNVNISVVADGGQPFGTAGAPEGDSRFGDIRIAARPLASTALAIGEPFSWTGTTWSGDIELNSNYAFSIGGGSGTSDLFSVVLHESGHSFGLPDESSNQSSVMYPVYTLRTGLSGQDITNFQALYGKPSPWASLGGGDQSGIQGSNPSATTYTNNNSFGTAANLAPRWGNPTDLRFDATAREYLNGPNDTDYFLIQSPDNDGSSALNLVAMVWGTDAASVNARIDLYDSNDNPLTSQVLANDHGTFTVQLPGVPANTRFYVEVSPLGVGPGASTGNYFLGVIFHTQPLLTLAPITSNILTPTSDQTTGSQQFSTFTANQNELMHFVLSASEGASTVAAEVQMQIYDASGNLVFSRAAYGNQPASSGIVLLTTGTYTVRFVSVACFAGELPTMSYNLRGESLSDPIGPQTTDPTSSPGSGCPDYTWTDTGSSSPNAPPSSPPMYY